MKTDDRKDMKAHTMEVTPGVEQAVNLFVINTKSRLDMGSYSFCLVQTTSNGPQGNVFISKWQLLLMCCVGMCVYMCICSCVYLMRSKGSLGCYSSGSISTTTFKKIRTGSFIDLELNN